MKIRDIMTRGVHIVSQDQTLQEAARLMRDEDVGMLPVFNGEKIVGTITDRDVTIQAVADGLNPTKAKVFDSMSKNVIFCDQESSLNDAAQLMKTHQIRRLLVVDKSLRPVGIVSLGDLAKRQEESHVPEEILKTVSEQRPH